jgi:hypothetical protein
MSKKLESILELLLAEENEKAEELLHEYVVDKAREQYESLLDDEVEEEEVSGVIDQSNDFVDDITSDEDEVHADEIGEEGDDEESDNPFADAEESEDESEGEEDLEDKVDDIADELESLKAEFEALMADGDEPEAELGDEEEADLEMGGEEELDLESVEYDLDEATDEDEDEVVEEATKLSDNVAAPKAGEADSTESPLTKAPKGTKVAGAGTPVKAKDGGEGVKGESAKDHTPTDNIKVEPKKA